MRQPAGNHSWPDYHDPKLGTLTDDCPPPPCGTRLLDPHREGQAHHWMIISIVYLLVRCLIAWSHHTALTGTCHVLHLRGVHVLLETRDLAIADFPHVADLGVEFPAGLLVSARVTALDHDGRARVMELPRMSGKAIPFRGEPHEEVLHDSVGPSPYLIAGIVGITLRFVPLNASVHRAQHGRDVPPGKGIVQIPHHLHIAHHPAPFRPWYGTIRRFGGPWQACRRQLLRTRSQECAGRRYHCARSVSCPRRRRGSRRGVRDSARPLEGPRLGVPPGY